MPLRKIEVTIPADAQSVYEKLVEDESILHVWHDRSSEEGDFLVTILIDAGQAEELLDKAEQLLSSYEGFRLLMMPVEATLPRIEKEEKEPEEEEPLEKKLQGLRVSREELYSKISEGISMNRIYLLMVVLSTIVAALGILRDNTAVVIGAMVIAPLLGPNVGLALSTALADFKLGIESLKSNFSGLAVALFISVVLGYFMTVDSSAYQIASRTEVHLSDISLALASGAAGVLAYTVGMSAAVIGVMVAVALLPPLVTAGLLLGDMQYELSVMAFLLLLTNVICVNLAAVGTFILQGVRPRNWFEAEKAKRANRIALVIWVVLVLILAAIIYYA